MADWSAGQFGNVGQPPAPGWPTMNPGFPSAPQPPMFGAPLGAPPPKRGKGMIIGLMVAAVVTVLAVLAALIIVLTRSGGGAESPQAAVLAYLEALARGDAAAALSYGQSQPPSGELLTDEILGRQIAKWPITDIRVRGTDDNSQVSKVHVSAKFGDEASEAELLVEKHDGWKLLNTFIKIDKTGIGQKDAQTVTVFGTPVDQPRYMFPGWVELASSNPNLGVTAKPMVLPYLDTGTSVTSMSFTLNAAAEQAIRAAITDSFALCTNSNLIKPPGCPVHFKASNYVDGTAKWGPIAGGENLSIVPLTAAMTASVTGTLTATITLQHTGGAVPTHTMTVPVHGSADLSTNPPKLTWN